MLDQDRTWGMQQQYIYGIDHDREVDEDPGLCKDAWSSPTPQQLGAIRKDEFFT